MLLLSLLLSSCMATVVERPVDSRSGVANLHIAEPLFQVGDRLLLNRGREQRVVSVAPDAVTWVDSKGRRWQGARYRFLPNLHYRSADREVRRSIRGALDEIRPLIPGRIFHYTVTTRRIAVDGLQAGRTDYWRCKAGAGERLVLAAGRFDILRLACQRTDELGRFRQRQIWFYSQKPGIVVRLIDQAPGREARGWELLAFLPALRLATTERMVLAKRFQHAMEYLPSGQSDRWSSSDGTLAVAITPLATLRQSAGTYCRQFQLRMDRGAEGVRWGVGVVCRDEGRKWRVPLRIQEGEQIRFGNGGEPF